MDRHGVADFLNGPNAFVTQGATGSDKEQVRAAETTVGDLDEDFIRLELGDLGRGLLHPTLGAAHGECL